MAVAVNLVVPLKRLAVAKSRLARGRLPRLAPDEHAALVLAMAMDTVAAAVAAAGVGRVLVVATAPGELAGLAALGAEVVGDAGAADLDTALSHGAAVLRADDPHCIVGALQGDLPALRPAELAAAVAAASGRRAFCADRSGDGTTLLLSAAAAPLEPRFGLQSARRHAATGAVRLALPVPTLRSDVDTPADLEHAQRLGPGRHTRTVLQAQRRAG